MARYDVLPTQMMSYNLLSMKEKEAASSSWNGEVA